MLSHLTNTQFTEFENLIDILQKNLQQENFKYCTPVQTRALPLVLGKKDVLVQAQTGTGKTLTFLLATINCLLQANKAKNNTDGKPRALILAPTRELAVQIHSDALKLVKNTTLKLALAYGGASYESQVSQIKQGIDILIGTSGRIIDYVRQSIVKLDQIEVLVLDEADRMFNLGFIKDIRFLIKKCPPAENRLTLLFSATLSYKIKELAFEHTNNAEFIEIEPAEKTNNNISEELFYPSNQDKMRLLLTLLEEEWPDKAIIFANTKHRCEEIYQYVKASDHRVGILTGNVIQSKRLQLLSSFKKGHIDILIATDVAARGLHIPAVSHVFNYDLPDDKEDYVHRIGRTGRAGATGKSISFACEEFAINLTAIEEYIGHKILVSRYDETVLLDLPKIK